MSKSNSQDKNFSLCAICTNELLLQYCQKSLSKEEQFSFENHLIDYPNCWENLIRFNHNISISHHNTNSLPKQSPAPNIDENIKIADLVTAEYFIKKKRDQLTAKSEIEPVKSNHLSTRSSWENLSEAFLLASMFPTGKTTRFIITQAWQEFFRRYEYTIVELIIQRYKSVALDQELSSQLLIHCIEAVFKYLQQNNYKRLRSLRDLPEVPIKQFLKFATYKVLKEIEPFNKLPNAEQKFIDSTLWRDKKALLIDLHGSKSSHLFKDEIKDQLSVINRSSKPFFLRSSNYFAVAALAVIASLPIGLLTYHFYNKAHSQSTNTTAVINDQINSHQINNQSVIDTPTRYDLFDQELDGFLQARINNNGHDAAIHLIAMERLAKEISSRKDNYGTDLLTFYRSVSPNSAYELYQARTLSSKAVNTPPGDNYNQVIADINQSNMIFNKYFIPIEILKNNLCRMGTLIKQGKSAQANQFIDDGLNVSEKSNYAYLHLLFLLEKGNLFLTSSEYEKATNIYKEVINIADNLETPKVALRPIMSLSGIYYISDRNEECFNLTQKGLKLAQGFNSYITVQLHQLVGVSAFNLGKVEISEDNLNTALLLSEKQQNLGMIAQSQMFIGIVKTMQNRLILAEDAFKKALEASSKMEDPLAKADIEISTTGYYARQQMLAGNADFSLELYEKSLSLAKELNINQNIMLSQLHKGKAEVLVSKGNHNEATSELQIAIALEKEAQAHSETTNALLCFAVTCKNAVEQLKELTH